MNPMFPMNQAVLEAAMLLFSKVSVVMVSLLTMGYVVRTSLAVTRVAPAFEYFEILKDAGLYLAMLSLYPMIVRMIMDLAEGIAVKIAFIPKEISNDSAQQFMDKFFGQYSVMAMLGSVAGFAFTGFASSLYTVFLSLLLAIAPIVLFLGVILGLSHGMRTYFASILSMCMWPILWNLLGKLGEEMHHHLARSPVSTIAFWTVIQLLQFLSPFLAVFLFRSLATASTAMKVLSFGRSWT